MLKRLLFVVFLFISVVAFSQKSIEKVYAAPNPFTTNTKVFIQTKTPQTVYFSVKNILGKTVYSKKVVLKKGKNSIPFSKNKLKSGLYIYAIKSKNEFFSKRIVIQ